MYCSKSSTQPSFESGNTQSSLEKRPAQDAGVSPSSGVSQQGQLMLPVNCYIFSLGPCSFASAESVADSSMCVEQLKSLSAEAR